MYAQVAIKPNPLLRNGAYGIVMRGVQKCTRGCSSLRGRNKLPLCCIKLDTATDPACGTGGFLTESFKVLLNNYEKSGTLTTGAREFLSKRCFYGVDVRDENISRTRLNMFLVGDGHTHMYSDNSLNPTKQNGKATLSKKYQYVITNPPYGSGTSKNQRNFHKQNRDSFYL